MIGLSIWTPYSVQNIRRTHSEPPEPEPIVPVDPSELPNLLAVYGARKIIPAYTGPLLQVVRNSDSETLDIYALEDGWIDPTDITTFCGENDGGVSIWYNQLETGTDLQADEDWSRPGISYGGYTTTIGSRTAPMFFGVSRVVSNGFEGILDEEPATLLAYVQAPSDTPENEYAQYPAFSVADMRSIGLDSSLRPHAFVNGEYEAATAESIAGESRCIVGTFGAGKTTVYVGDETSEASGSFSTKEGQIAIGVNAWGDHWTGGVGEAILCSQALTEDEAKGVILFIEDKWKSPA